MRVCLKKPDMGSDYGVQNGIFIRDSTYEFKVVS